MTDPPEPWTAIYSSPLRSACDERAFVLAAVGIASAIGFDGLVHSLAVARADQAIASAQLRSYEQERPAGPLRAAAAAPPARVPAGAWLGSVVYVLVLLGVALAISNGLWPAEAFERGVLDAARVQSGQWWRAWTALTLHWDAAHLVANLGAGVWFGTLAGRQLGGGCAWLLTVTGAALANLFDAHFGPPWYRSAGASTAVFAALGLMSAHSWRTRRHLPQQWARRWAPLIAGVVLLGWFGTAGEGTDVVAHALGFTMGALFGVLAALPAVARLLQRLPQWLLAALALASLGAAWRCALTHSAPTMDRVAHTLDISPMEFPADADGDALRRVAEDGADMSSPMVIDYSVTAPDERAARVIAALVEAQGFDPSISDAGGGGSWSVYCSKSMLATYEGVVNTQAALNALVASYGGRCDGWASFGNGG